jgi:hypothetical protein
MTQWTIELKRDADYWEEQVTVKDENGAPVPFSDARITIHPDSDDPNVVWSIDNLRLMMPSDGVFTFEVPMTEIADYVWSSGNFCWSVTYSDGHVDNSWMVGRVTIKDACL